MKWTHTAAACRSRKVLAALCVRALCVACLYLAHTVLNGGHTCGALPYSASGLESLPAEEERGSFACGEACFDTDEILPKTQENDPFLAFLALTSLTPPLSVEPAEHLRGAPFHCADMRPAEVLHPHLRFLAHASQVLC